jgi:hypothetical protein
MLRHADAAVSFAPPADLVYCRGMRRTSLVVAVLAMAALGCSSSTTSSTRDAGANEVNPSDVGNFGAVLDLGISPDVPAASAPSLDCAIEIGPTGETGTDGLNTTEAGTGSIYSDACTAVASSTFVAVGTGECGLTPAGVAQCNWRLTFDGVNRTVKWAHSDMVETVSYQCSGFTLITTGGLGAGYAATYHPDTGILTWNGGDYAKATGL